MIGDFWEYGRRDHEWIANHLDIWQLSVYMRRIQLMRIKESREQALLFYAATSGMNGIKFKGIKSPGQFFKPPDLTPKEPDTEREVNDFIRAIGGA